MSATIALAMAAMLALGALPAAASAYRSSAARPASAPRCAPLTNLAHLDFLGDTVTPPEQAGHTTYRLAEEPELGVLWTYADPRDGGVYGGSAAGAYDAGDRHLGPGRVQRRRPEPGRRRVPAALAADRRRRTAATRAYQLLRGLTYLQTATGDDAGNVVAVDAAGRHPQPQRRAGRAARPERLRRVVLAGPHGVGARRGLRGVRRRRPRVRRVPRATASDLSLDALERESLSRTGSGTSPTGTRVPGWLIVDGADATRRGRARPGGLRRGRTRGRRRRSRPDRADAVRRGHRRDVRRRRAAGRTARSCPGPTRSRCGTAGARRWPPRWPAPPRCVRPARPAARRGPGRGRVHALPAHRDRSDQRVAARPRST